MRQKMISRIEQSKKVISGLNSVSWDIRTKSKTKNFRKYRDRVIVIQWKWKRILNIDIKINLNL